MIQIAKAEDMQFQFTPLREGRPFRPADAQSQTHFNSRPSARGDQKFTVEACFEMVFQFTPLREGRQRKGRAVRQVKTFQFTPLREGRHVTPFT